MCIYFMVHRQREPLAVLLFCFRKPTELTSYAPLTHLYIRNWNILVKCCFVLLLRLIAIVNCRDSTCAKRSQFH